MSTPPGPPPPPGGGDDPQEGWGAPPPPPGGDQWGQPQQPQQPWGQPEQQVWGQPTQQPQWSGGQPAGGQQTNGMAIGSLVASILGLVCFYFIGPIIGVILGYMARKQIRESGGAQGGEGMAMAGIIIGWIGIALSVLGMVFFFAVLGAGFATGY